MIDHAEFLTAVHDYIQQHPEVAAYVQQHVAAGVSAAMENAMKRAADMETALAVAVSRRYGGGAKLISEMLKRWQNKSTLRWDDTIAELDKLSDRPVRKQRKSP